MMTRAPVSGGSMPHTQKLPSDLERIRLLARGLVVAEPGRCVQCGMCAFNCPMGIDIRRFSRAGRPITDRRCVLCGACVTRCPRGTLRFELDDADASAVASLSDHQPSRAAVPA